MHPPIVRSWGLVLFRGILAVLFGLGAFFLPLATAAALVTLFGAFALVDGIFALVAAFRVSSRDDRWWPLIFEGIFGLLAGLIAFFYPGATALSLVYLAAGWALVTGVLEIAAAVRLRKVIDNEFWLGLSGVLSVVAGVLFFLEPAAGLVVIAWTIGFYALLYGVALIALSLRLKAYGDRMSRGDGAVRHA